MGRPEPPEGAAKSHPDMSQSNPTPEGCIVTMEDGEKVTLYVSGNPAAWITADNAIATEKAR